MRSYNQRGIDRYLASPRYCVRLSCKAFTLVELLVVIGIIALLIAIILPALGKARQQANLIVCQTHLRQLGQITVLYAGDNKGVLPYGYWNGTPNPVLTPGGYDSSKAGDWSTLLTNELSGRYGNNYRDQGIVTNGQANNRGVFLDVDATQGDAPIQYSCHPRLMPNLSTTLPDGTSYGGCVPYKLAHVERSSEIVLIMDGTLASYNPLAHNGSPDTAYWGSAAVAQTVNAWKFLPTSGADFFLLGKVPADDGSPINPGGNVDDTGTATPIPYVNFDGDIRWRHKNNRAANFLFVDGHVETRVIAPNTGGGTKQPYKTDLLGRNFNVNR